MSELTIQQAFQVALQHHRAGRLSQAEQIYRQILGRQPRHAEALHLLGVIAHQAGRHDVAVDLIRQAIALQDNFPQAHSDLGLALKNLGRPDEAIAAFRQAIALKPGYPAAHYNLGNALRDQRHTDEAINAYHQAIALKPNYPEAHNNLGVALADARRFDEAIIAYRQAIALKPNYPEAHNNLGVALTDSGHCNEAVASLRQAIALKPGYPEAHNNLGNALQHLGLLDDAVAAFRQALALKPNYPEAHSNLGAALKDQGRLDEAIAALRQALAVNPDYPEAHINLGNALREKGRLHEAITAYRQAIALNHNLPEAHNNLGVALTDAGYLDEAIAAVRQALVLNPNYPEAHSSLGNALTDQGHMDEAIAAYRQAIALDADHPEAHSNLGNALKEQGQLDEAMAAFRRAIALKPDLAETHSNLVFTMYYHPGCAAPALAQEQGRWNQQHAEPLRQFILPHANDRNPDRRLRIGYVSPDLREHAVGRFLLPLLARHDHQRFEIFAYAQVPRPDALTDQLRAHCDHWHSLVGLADESAAQLIRRHQIDILVDLTMHTAHNRLLVFARKPAPVQVTWLALPGSTGLAAIDYRLSDPCLDPPGTDESVYSEQTLRLPHSFWCYDPLEDRAVSVNPLPALASNFITFGCLNAFCKVNDGVLRLWAQVLQAVPFSRLLLLVPEGSSRQRSLEILAQEGIAPERIEFAARQPRRQYLEQYHRIDLALDPFPYCGGTTSCEALWMGVPVITLRGGKAVGRAGASILSNAGFPDLIADTPADYIRIAAHLAADLPRLAELRRTLRGRMQSSPLMNARQFAMDIESIYCQVWQKWCADKCR